MAKIISLKDISYNKESKDLDNYSIRRKRYWFVPQANGKLLSEADQLVLNFLIDYTAESSVANFHYPWLQMKFNKSQKTITRILKKLSNLFDIKLIHSSFNKKGYYQRNLLQIARTLDFNNIISKAIFKLEQHENKILSSKQKRLRGISTRQPCLVEASNNLEIINNELVNDVLSTSQMCLVDQTDMSSTYIENKKEIKQSISSKKTRARIDSESELALEKIARKEHKENLSHNELFLAPEKQENSFAFSVEKESILAMNEQKEEQNLNNAQEEKLTEAEVDIANSSPKYSQESDLEMELKYELSKNFSLQTYSKLSRLFTFEFEKKENKLKIVHEAPLSILSLAEKETLKKIAAKVYGEGVNIVTTLRGSKITLGTKSHASSDDAKEQVEQWESVKEGMRKKIGADLVKCWFNSVQVSFDEDRGKIIGSTSDFTLDWIDTNYHNPLSEVLSELGYSLELSGSQQNGEKKSLKLPFAKYCPKEGDFSLNEIMKQHVLLKSW